MKQYICRVNCASPRSVNLTINPTLHTFNVKGYVHMLMCFSLIINDRSRLRYVHALHHAAIVVGFVNIAVNLTRLCMFSLRASALVYACKP